MKFRIGRMQEVLHQGVYGLVVDTYYILLYKVTFVGFAFGFRTFGITVYKTRGTDDE